MKSIFRPIVSCSAMLLLALALATACATSPTGRKQLMLVPEAQMDQLGVQAFSQIKQQTPADSNAQDNAYVQCVAGAITSVAPTDVKQWEVVVFDDKQVNAFALPGGKIGVYTGILPVAKTDAELGAVLGHEVGHVIAKHGAERASEQLGEAAILQGLGTLAPNSAQGQVLMGALGLGTQVGIQLPHSRTQEAEADDIGIDLMAKAGFDPHQAIELWKNMDQAAGGQAPPEWLSDHPADANRIKDLESKLPAAVKTYQAAVSAGRHPHCEPPRTVLGSASVPGAGH